MPKSGSRTILARQTDPAHRVPGRDGAVQSDGLEMAAPHHLPVVLAHPEAGRAVSLGGDRGAGSRARSSLQAEATATRSASLPWWITVGSIACDWGGGERTGCVLINSPAAPLIHPRSLCRRRMGGHLMPSRYTGMGGPSERCGAAPPRLPWRFPEIKALD